MPGIYPPSQPPTTQKSAFAAMNGASTPQPKKRKLTFKEKEDELILKQIRDSEKAEREAAREADRKKKEADKATKDAEKKKRETERAIKEAERKKREIEKEAEKLAKEAERKKKEAEKEEKRIALEAERAAKAELKRKKDEEKQLAEEKKKKEQQKQKPINSFFGKPAASPAEKSAAKGRSMSPAPSNPVLSTIALSEPPDAPSKTETLPYHTLFPAFFRKEDVSLAPINRFERDEEASTAVQALVDSYINGDRSLGRQHSFDAFSLFHLPSQHTLVRGKRCTPVREIMAEFAGNSSRPIDLTTDSQNSQIKRTSELLKRVPMKFLKFQEDVRPPYRGTYTSRPVNGISKLARNPMRRDLPNTNYDYDSEAEWVEEEGDEDLDSDGEDEEIDDDVDDMEGFLDDEGDVAVNSKRLVVQGDLEPVSTGLCWEDQHKKNKHVKMVAYRMEIILSESLVFFRRRPALTISDPKLKSIDPFSTEYWAPASKTTKMEPPRVPLDALKPSASSMNAPNTNKTVKPFFTVASDVAKISGSKAIVPGQTLQNTGLSSSSKQDKSKADKPKKLLPSEDMELFRNEVRGSDLSKVGMIEVLKKKFPQRTAAQVKGTLETFGSRVGKKEADKRWVLVDETTS